MLTLEQVDRIAEHQIDDLENIRQSHAADREMYRCNDCGTYVDELHDGRCEDCYIQVRFGDLES